MTTPIASHSAAVHTTSGGGARGWRGPRNWIATAAIAMWVPGCAVACWWQVTIALSGDGLGWAYSVMWPCFAVFGLVVWWHFVHDDPDMVGARELKRLRDMALREASTSGAPSSETGLHEEARTSASPDGVTEGPPPEAVAHGEAEDAELAEYNAYLASLACGAPKTWRRSRSG